MFEIDKYFQNINLKKIYTYLKLTGLASFSNC